MFGGSEEEPEVIRTYPGSTKRIRWGNDAPDVDKFKVRPASDPIFNKANWGKPTAIEVVPDHVFMFYRPNVFAKILGKSGPTLKFWEQKGFVPKPPFRFRFENTVRNYYNEETILAFLKLLNERGQLHDDRIDWAHFPELPDLIRKEWERIRDEWLAEVKKLTTH
jgi:DNA-binding transcriptional MerR regulator